MSTAKHPRPLKGVRPLYIIDRQPFNRSLADWLGVNDLGYATMPYWTAPGYTPLLDVHVAANPDRGGRSALREPPPALPAPSGKPPSNFGWTLP
ncbi:MAG: hypothetical protein JNJ61_22310 [Anaerolineae bacterium]|nr:hypothetical protein [Anaerolineae bacterium]